MIKKILYLACIACCFLWSCSDDKEEAPLPRYFESVIQAKSFSAQEIKTAYPEIFESTPILSTFIKEVHVVAIRYRTKDAYGNAISASGIIAYPSDEIKEITGMQHSTYYLKSEAPSRQLLVPEIIPVFFNRLVIMADYLGFGVSESSSHPFMQSELTGRTCTDMFLAAHEYLTLQEFRLPDAFTLAGYSQGGSATLATLREIERTPGFPWQIKHTYAGGGVYDFKATFDHFLEQNHMTMPALAPYLIRGLDARNEINLNELFIDPSKVTNLLDGHHDSGEINAQLGYRLNAILHPDFYTAESNASIRSLYKIVDENTLLNWTPRSPVTLMHAVNDDVVPYFNSTEALDEFRSRGNQVQLIDLNGNHNSGAINFFIKMLL